MTKTTCIQIKFKKNNHHRTKLRLCIYKYRIMNCVHVSYVWLVKFIDHKATLKS